MDDLVVSALAYWFNSWAGQKIKWLSLSDSVSQLLNNKTAFPENKEAEKPIVKYIKFQWVNKLCSVWKYRILTDKSWIKGQEVLKNEQKYKIHTVT